MKQFHLFLLVGAGWLALVFFLSNHSIHIGDYALGAPDALPEQQEEAPALTSLPVPEVDVVITYVKSDDEDWMRKLDYFGEHSHVFFEWRWFRDWGEIRFCLRSVWFHAPWVRSIVLVVASSTQIPIYVNRSHPKLRIVLHEDIFPAVGDLPTFNPNAIESCLHHIPGLSRYFLYMNNDMFFGRPLEWTDVASLSADGKTWLPKLFFEALVEHPCQGESGTTCPEIVEGARRCSQHNGRHRIQCGIPHLHHNLVYHNVGLAQELFHTVAAGTFAHTPRLFDKTQLLGLEQLIRSDYVTTRQHRFRHWSNVWVPYLYNHYVLHQQSDRPSGSVAIPLQGHHHLYSFRVLRSDRDIETAAGDFTVESVLQQPLFITLNDNVEENAQTATLMNQLLSLVGGRHPAPWETTW